MRALGIILTLIGIIWVFIAVNMSTTVRSELVSLGSGELSIYVPSQVAHNLGLAEKRRSRLLVSGVLIIVGTILFGFGSISKSITVQSGVSPSSAKRNEGIRHASKNLSNPVLASEYAGAKGVSDEDVEKLVGEGKLKAYSYKNQLYVSDA